jgi:hypothetical protein
VPIEGAVLFKLVISEYSSTYFWTGSAALEEPLKFHPEIKILLKLGCQQATCITNKTRDAIKKQYR